MTARRHHHVPQCYLRGFVKDRDDPQLFVVDAKEARVFRTSPANVAAERDFNRIDVEGLPPDALEQGMSGFESEVSNALARIISARSILDRNDRELLFNLIALMAARNPGRREMFRSVMEQTTKIIMGMALATPERWESQMRRAKADGYIALDAATDYEKMKAFIESGAYEIEVANERHIELELQSQKRLLPLIFHRRWVLFKAPPGRTGFITSDHPVCLMWSDPKQRGKFHGPGYGLRRTQIVFPISNELAMIGAFEAEEAAYDADTELIAEINGAVMTHSLRQVYARDQDFTYILGHNRRIMTGDELLLDQATLHRKHTKNPAKNKES